MIRIRVVKAYELAVAVAALLLVAAIIALLVTALSGGKDAVTTSAPLYGGEQPFFGTGNATAQGIPMQEEKAVTVFSSSAGDMAPLFAVATRAPLRAKGEEIAQNMYLQTESTTNWERAPTVLVYHTHTYEAYTMEQDGLYEETESWRTADSAFNVTRVGKELVDELRARGINAVQDTTNHELPVLGTAYSRSLQTISAHLDAGETYDLCIDLHRDAYSGGSGENTVDTPSGKAARVLFLIGRGSNFSAKPDVQANTSFAWELTEKLNASVPGLCKDVLVKDNRYNQHLGGHAILIEAGNNYNTISEVLRTVPYLADAISECLQQTSLPQSEYMQVLENIK